MQVHRRNSCRRDLATAADAFAAWLLDRIGNRLFGAADESTTEELSTAWTRVRSKPGRLSTRTSDEWSRIQSFMGFSGFGWFMASALIGVLFLVIPVPSWAGTLAHIGP
ncbi:hypothetical protein [Streptomyces sp. SYSU K217416]